MLTKARQADRYYREKGRPSPMKTTGVDELRYLVATSNVMTEGENSAVISALQSPAQKENEVDEHTPPSPNPRRSFTASSMLGLPYVLSQPHSSNTSPGLPQDSIEVVPRPPQDSIETFADICEGWNGLLHDVPGHQYAQMGAPGKEVLVSGLQSSSHQNSYDVSNSSGYHHHPQQGSSDHATGRPNALMLDDRWASFINYGLGNDNWRSQ